jgi:hypothetical protein
MKLQLQLMIEDKIIKKCRERKLNISDTVNKLLRRLLESESSSAEEIILAVLQAEKDDLLHIIDNHRATIERMELLIAASDMKIKKHQALIVEVRRSERIAAFMKELNEQITQEVTIKQLLTLPVIQSLKGEGVPITPEWLERHIRRIDLLGR